MLDLTKLKALELPTKEIEVEILGEKQTVKITCPGEDIAARVSMLYDARSEDPAVSVDIIKTFAGAALPDMATEELELLLKADFKAGTVIAAAARDLLTEFIKAKKKCHEETEKNLPAAESTPGVNC